MSKLTLVPTPICDELAYCAKTKAHLLTAFENGEIIIVEEHKVARRKWLANGLPREAIETFVCYNEHSRKEALPELMKELKRGRSGDLLSDCGLPAFCDPGKLLVDRCHLANIQVTSLPFNNSVALALALSGFDHERFIFEGFISRSDRLSELKRISRLKETTILMDTPYRLEKILQELSLIGLKKSVFVALDLNSPTERLVRGPIEEVVKSLAKVNKREFVLVLGPL